MKNTIDDRYSITEDGRVYSHISGRYLKAQNDNDGKLSIRLAGKKMYIHRLVAIAYLPNPMNKPQVDHIDGDRSNNSIYNLRWCTDEENQLFRIEQGIVGAGDVYQQVEYDGVVYPSIRTLSRAIADERGSKSDTVRKAIKAARHGEIILYGKKCKYV